MFSTLTLSTDPRGVTTMTLNRPEVHNALSAGMISELTEAAEHLGRDTATRVVVLTGAGPSFCAGADLGWMKSQLTAALETRATEARRLARMLRVLNEMPKPLIGRIQGQAFGGGLGLMAVCDVAVGSDQAVFAFTETRLGLIPATIGPYVLARMGEGRARRVFMSARRFDAPEAVSLDLLARAVPADALDAAVEAEVTPYLATAPGAVAAAKQLARRLGPVIDDAAIEASVEALIAQWQGGEAADGIAAFFDRRTPGWKHP